MSIGKKLLSPKNDYVFKRIFGYVGNEEITKDFLNSIMDIEVQTVNLDNNKILEQDLKTDKFGVLDIRATLNDNVECDIEMQVVDREDITERILFYWSKMYTKSIKLGENYNELKKTVVILITDYEIEELKEVEKSLSKWQIKEKDYVKSVLTNKMELYIMELPKATKYNDLNKTLKSWVKFIESPEVLNMEDVKENKNIEKAQKVLQTISDDEREEYLAEQRLIYIMDQKAIELSGYNKGKKAEKIEIAKKMLEQGSEIEFIMTCTGLTKEEIEKLK